MPCDYSKYPPNWKTEIRPAILKRAGNKCEFCGVRNGVIGYRNKSGRFFEIHPEPDAEAEQMTDNKIIMIVLTVAHLNHDVTDGGPENLKALCQKCHLDHDREHHAETRRKNKNQNSPELPGFN